MPAARLSGLAASATSAAGRDLVSMALVARRLQATRMSMRIAFWFGLLVLTVILPAACGGDDTATSGRGSATGAGGASSVTGAGGTSTTRSATLGTTTTGTTSGTHTAGT